MYGSSRMNATDTNPGSLQSRLRRESLRNHALVRPWRNGSVDSIKFGVIARRDLPSGETAKRVRWRIPLSRGARRRPASTSSPLGPSRTLTIRADISAVDRVRPLRFGSIEREGILSVSRAQAWGCPHSGRHEAAGGDPVSCLQAVSPHTVSPKCDEAVASTPLRSWRFRETRIGDFIECCGRVAAPFGR